MENTLQHHGVMGMHWRHRKGSAPLKPLLPNTAVNESKRAHENLSAYRHRDQMSNKALKSKVDRLRNEKALEDLVKEPYRRAAAEKSAKRSRRIKTLLTVYGGVAPAVAAAEGLRTKNPKLAKILNISGKAASNIKKNMNQSTILGELEHSAVIDKEKVSKKINKLANKPLHEASLKNDDNSAHVEKGRLAIKPKSSRIIAKHKDKPINSDTLHHSGVRGMHWGTRKAIIKAGGREDLKRLQLNHKLINQTFKDKKIAYKQAKRSYKLGKKIYKTAKRGEENAVNNVLKKYNITQDALDNILQHGLLEDFEKNVKNVINGTKKKVKSLQSAESDAIAKNYGLKSAKDFIDKDTYENGTSSGSAIGGTEKQTKKFFKKVFK